MNARYDLHESWAEDFARYIEEHRGSLPQGTGIRVNWEDVEAEDTWDNIKPCYSKVIAHYLMDVIDLCYAWRAIGRYAMEKQVMHILSKLYRNDNRCWREDYHKYSEAILSEKEKEILSKCGWEINDIVHFESHGDTLKKLMTLKDNCDLSRERCIDAFVAGVGGSYLRGRSILAAWLLLDKIQPHAYYEKPQFRCCWVCGTGDKDSVIKTINNSYLQYCLHLGHLYYEPKYVYLNLKYFAEQPDVMPTEYDIAIFRKLIELIRNAPDDERPSQCEKRLKSEKFLPSTMTIRAVLQTLSLCGVLPNKYIELSENTWNDWGDVALCGKQIKAPARSDLEMPWAGWNGSMKINEERTERLFGRYISIL